MARQGLRQPASGRRNAAWASSPVRARPQGPVLAAGSEIGDTVGVLAVVLGAFFAQVADFMRNREE